MKKKSLAVLLAIVIVIGSLICMPETASAATTAKLSSTSKMIEVGKSFTLTVTGTKDKATFASADKSIAAVTAKGKVTAKKVGKTTITAKVGRQTLKCTVRVTYKRTKFTLRGQTFTLAIPPTWTYVYGKTAYGHTVSFYDKYVYENFENRGYLFCISAQTDQQFRGGFYCGYYGKFGGYRISALFETGYGIIGDTTADEKFSRSLRQIDSVAATFLPAPKSAKQKVYNAYFSYLANDYFTGCSFALAYITKDTVPELIIDTTNSRYYGNEIRNTIEIYTYKNGEVTLLCTTGNRAAGAGYYFRTGIACGVTGMVALGTHYINVYKDKELLYHVYMPNTGGRKHTYYNGYGQAIRQATFNAYLKKITGGKKLSHYAFCKNTLANRKKALNN